jgi:tetratricopeptide (TPR) repeat protein
MPTFLSVEYLSRRSARRLLAALPLLALLFLPAPGLGQLEQLTEDEAILQAMLAQAETKFNSGLGPESIVDVRKVIGMAQQFATARTLSEREKDVLLRAHLLQARALFNLGQIASAQENLREALRLNARFELNQEEVSPKVIDLLETLKKQEIGTLFVDSEPGGAEVFLDGERIGLTPLFATPAYKGVHELEVRVQGYESYSERITVLPDQQLQRNVVLSRVTGDVIVYSQPSGARVYIDGELAGVTSGSPSPEDLERFGPEYDFSELSGPLTISYVKPGVHTLKVEKNCFEARVENISVDTETREFPPFKLGPSRATLLVESPIDGAKVYLGDQFLGSAPVEQDAICTGEYLLRVEKDGVGRYFQNIRLAKDQRTAITAELRPTLAFVGLAPHPDNNLVQSVTQRLRDGLQEVATVNLRTPDADQVRAALAAAAVPSLADLARSNIPADRRDVVANQLRTICERLECDLLLLGAFPEQRLQNTVNLYLYLGGHGYADVVPLEFQSPSDLRRFFGGLGYRPSLSKSWMGMLTVDLLHSSGVGVVRVSEGGPARLAGIQPGDTLLSIDDEPIASNRAFRQKVEQSRPGTTFQLQAQSGGNPRAVEIRIDKTPVEIPKNNPDLLYNKILADLQLLGRQAQGDFDKNFAQLNMAVAYMHFKNWQSAVDTLGKIRFDTKSGITNGTVFYYLGEALSALDYRPEAISNYQKAKAFENATVGTNDGELVPLLADKKLKDLQ